jgi:hypothetical protein
MVACIMRLLAATPLLLAMDPVTPSGYVDPRILAPEGTVIVRAHGSVSGGAYARRVDVRGGYAL